MDYWRDDAACAARPELFFGPDGEYRFAHEKREREAKAVCALCPVQAQCLAYALAVERGLSVDAVFGVYGGAGEAERRAMRAGGAVTGLRLLPVVERLASGFKRCCRCCDDGEVLPLSAFGKATRRADGLTAWCRDCNNDYQRERHVMRAAPNDPMEALMNAMEWVVSAACQLADDPDLFFPPGRDDEEPDWQDLARCTEVDGELFFPEKGGSTREAKKVCRGCEVRASCLEYALENDERFGIWGGLSERERRRLKRERGLGEAA